jgi:hypothetical protein
LGQWLGQMINVNFTFTPLKELWVGDCYPENFYNHLPNEIADPFKQITQWTKEDLTSLQTWLEDRDIVVRRPKFKSIDQYLDANDQLVKPPVTPRDDYLVLNDTLHVVHKPSSKHNPWQHCLDSYQLQGSKVVYHDNDSVTAINPPSVVKVGRDIYVDTASHNEFSGHWQQVCEWMVELGKDYRVNVCDTAGHSDAVFGIISPQQIITSHYKTDYSQSFPGWNIHRVPQKASILTLTEHPSWTVFNTPHINQNKFFSDYIVQNASSWVGNYSETVTEVNILCVDPKNVVLMTENPIVIEQLESIGITVHVFPLRTWSFWDGGWSCFTLDVHRDDTKEDLFPERGENGVYWRLK